MKITYKPFIRALVLTLIVGAIALSSSIDLTTQAQHFKIVNGHAGVELMIKASVRVTEIIPIVYREDLLTQIIYGMYIGLGVSQQYTAMRASQFAYNHYGDRFDWSLGLVFNGIEAIYTHSIRNKYSGAHPDVLFFNQDVDSIKFRYKVRFNI